MRINTGLVRFIFAASSSFLIYSCQKSMTDTRAIQTAANSPIMVDTRVPYQFARINEHNFSSLGWRKQQVNNVSGAQIFSDESEYVKTVRGPEDISDPRLVKGCITMNLPTGQDPTLRRIRLRLAGYSGTKLADLTELKYSTYVVNNAPTTMVLQVDVTDDDAKDFNIFFEPRQPWQVTNFPSFVLNSWQQWNALEGTWYVEAATISGLPEHCTIAELTALYPNARIIDTPPVGHNGEGVRFTIGGTPRSLFDDTIGYFDGLIIGTKDRQHSTYFDFTSSQGND